MLVKFEPNWVVKQDSVRLSCERVTGVNTFSSEVMVQTDLQCWRVSFGSWLFYYTRDQTEG